MIRRRKKSSNNVDVVQALQQRVQQAQALSAIPEQDLLANPSLNPATRSLADRLQAERLRARLEAEHRRVLRAQRETERRRRRPCARPRLLMPRALPRTPR